MTRTIRHWLGDLLGTPRVQQWRHSDGRDGDALRLVLASESLFGFPIALDEDALVVVVFEAGRGFARTRTVRYDEVESATCGSFSWSVHEPGEIADIA